MHKELGKLSLNHKQNNENTNIPSWKGIPNDLEPIILDFYILSKPLHASAHPNTESKILDPILLNGFVMKN